VDREKIIGKSFQSERGREGVSGLGIISISRLSAERKAKSRSRNKNAANVTQASLPSASTMIAAPCRCQTSQAQLHAKKSSERKPSPAFSEQLQVGVPGGVQVAFRNHPSYRSLA
jgi:hypothetical protein